MEMKVSHLERIPPPAASPWSKSSGNSWGKSGLPAVPQKSKRERRKRESGCVFSLCCLRSARMLITHQTFFNYVGAVKFHMNVFCVLHWFNGMMLIRSWTVRSFFDGAMLLMVQCFFGGLMLASLMVRC